MKSTFILTIAIITIVFSVARTEEPTKVNVNAFGVQVGVNVNRNHPQNHPFPHLHLFAKRSANNGDLKQEKISTKQPASKSNTKVNVNAFGVQVGVTGDGHHHVKYHPLSLLHLFGKSSAKPQTKVVVEAGSEAVVGVSGEDNYQKMEKNSTKQPSNKKNTVVNVNAFGVQVGVNVDKDQHHHHPLSLLYLAKRPTKIKVKAGSEAVVRVGEKIEKISTKQSPSKKNTKVNVNAFGVQVGVNVDGNHSHHYHPLSILNLFRNSATPQTKVGVKVESGAIVGATH